MHNLLNSANTFHHDFEFVVNGEVIPVHKCIIGCRSQYFFRVLASGMKEAIESRYEIKDTTNNAMKLLLKYLYTDFLDFPPEDICDVMLLADRFIIPRLHYHCKQHIKATIDNSNAARWFRWADEKGVDWLKKVTKRRIIDNLAAIRHSDMNSLKELGEARPDLVMEIFTL
jgi:hypothetical protein